MRKSKFRLHFAMTFVCAVPLLYGTLTAQERTRIDISNDYFKSGNINSGNQSAVYLNSQGSDGYGFFFLGESDARYTENPDHDPENPNDPDYYISYILEHNGTQIKCYEKLNGYYATNFTNFGMFPIDENTANKINNGVIFVTGGLFADCKDMNGNFLDDGDGVFGYIKWQYGEDGENTHEIRAGVTETGRKTESDLRLYRTNNHVSLNGFIHDSLAKKSRVVPQFKVIIDIPNQYFSQTKVLSENVDEIYFLNQWNNGFGLFFLGTGIDGTFRITSPQQNETIICSKQINGYYSVSFHDFGMFPLDEETRKNSASLAQSGITILNGGLYYNCRLNGVQYTGVYGYIKWKHGSYSNPENTHELRVGMDSSGNWLPISPLEIIYSENSRNNNRALSGSFHSSIAKHGDVESRLFGDLGLSVSGQNLSTRSGKKLLIDYEYFWSNDFKIYVKSSIPGTELKSFKHRDTIRPNGFGRKYKNSDNEMITISGENIPMQNTKTNMGFNGLYETGFQKLTGTSNGVIAAVLTNNDKKWTDQITFELTNTAPEITISRIPNSSVLCTSGLIITASGNRNTQTIKYTIKDEPCTNHYTTNYEHEYTTGGIFLDDDAYNNKYICFMAENDIDVGYTEYQITGLDTTVPNITSISTISGYECSDDGALGQIISNDNGGCGIIQLNYEKSGETITVQGTPSTNGFIFNITETSNIAEDRDIPFTLVDTAGNRQTGVITLSWQDVPVTGHNYAQIFRFNRDANGNVNGVASEGNWKTKSEATAGSCETIQAEVLQCNTGTGSIEGDLMSYFGRITTLQGWNGNCRLRIFDDDGSSEISVVMNGSCSSGCIDLSPKIVGGDNFVNRCFTGDKENLLSKGINGLFLNDSECSTFPQTSPSTRPKKYTSGSKIQIELNPTQDGTPAQAYRVSCIQNDTYCLSLQSGRNDVGCDDIYTGFFTEILNCTLAPGSQCTTKYLTQESDTCEGKENCSCRNGWFSTVCQYQVPYTDCPWQSCTDPGQEYYETILGCSYYCKDHRQGRRYIRNDCTRRNANGERCTTRQASDINNSTQLKGEVEANIENYANQCRRYWNTITNGSGGYKCEDAAIAWSNWIPYPGNSLTDAGNIIIERDLENGSGCAKNGNITMNGSKYLGERTVWVQLKDKSNAVSAKRETDIVVYDIPEYSGVVNYTTGGHFPRLSITDNKNILNGGIQQILHVTDIERLHGISGFSGSKTEIERQILELYERFIKGYSYKAIAKSMTSERFEKGHCNQTITKTGEFNVYMGNTCTCIAGDCTGNYQQFSGLTRHIPAIDNGCKSISAIEITGVTLEQREDNPNIICEGEATFDENGNIIDSGSLTQVNCNTPTFDHREAKPYTDIQACDNACATDRRGCYGNDDENGFGGTYHWQCDEEDRICALNAALGGGSLWYKARDVFPKEPIDACIGGNLTPHTSNSGYACYLECKNGNCYDNDGHKLYSCLPQGTEHTIETGDDAELCNAYCKLGICYRYQNGKWNQMDSCIGSGNATQSDYINDAQACNSLCQDGICYNNNGGKIDSCLSTVDTDNRETYKNLAQCNFACEHSAEGCYVLNNQGQAIESNACDSEFVIKSYSGNNKRVCDNICQNNECFKSNDKNNNYIIHSCIGSGRRTSQNFENEETCKSFCNGSNGNCYDDNGETITACIKSNGGTRYFSGTNAKETCKTSCQNGNCYDDNRQLTGSCTPDPKQKTFDTETGCTTSCKAQNGNCYDASGHQITQCTKSNMLVESFTTNNRQTNRQNCNNALISGNSFDTQGNAITSCEGIGNLQTTGNYTNKKQCDAACSATNGNCYDTSGNRTGSCYNNGSLQIISNNYTNKTQCDNACKALSGNCYDATGNHTDYCYRTPIGSLQASNMFDNLGQCNAACSSSDNNCYDNNGYLTGSCFISGSLQTSTNYTNKAQCDAACTGTNGNCYNNAITPQLTGSCYNDGDLQTTGNYSNKTQCDNACKALSGNCYDNNGSHIEACYTITGNIHTANYNKNKASCDTACKDQNGNCYDNNGETQIEKCYIVTNGNSLSNSRRYYSNEKTQCDAACADLSGNCYNNNQLTGSCYGDYFTTDEWYTNKTTCDNKCRNLSGNCYDDNNQLTGSCYEYTLGSQTYYGYKYYYRFRYKYNKNYSYQFKYYDTSYQYNYYNLKYKYNDFRYKYYSGYSYKYNYYNLTFKYFKDFYFGHYDYSYNYNDYHHKYYGDIHYNYYDNFYYYEPTHYFYKNKYYYYEYPEYYSYRANSYFYNTAESFYYNVPMYTKNGCSDTGYDYCTKYSCTDYSGGNTYECSYSQCTDYGNGCILYEINRVQTGNYLEDGDCECVITTGSTAIDMDKIPSNELYRYGCISDPDNPAFAQCYQCAAWECNVRGNCLAYDSGTVTYFSTQLKRERNSSNLKLTNKQKSFGTSGFKFQYENGKDVMLSSISIENQGTKWTNDTDIKINVNFMTGFECVKEYREDHCFECIGNGAYTLTIPQNIITDFSLNGTNGLSITYVYDHILTKPLYCGCDRSTCDSNTEYKYEECGNNCCYCLQHDGIKGSPDPRCKMGDGVFRAEQQNQISSPEGPQDEYTGTIDIYSSIVMNGHIEFINGGNCPGFEKDSLENMCLAKTGAGHPLTTNELTIINKSGQPIKVNPDQLGINYKLTYHLSGVDNDGHYITNWDDCIIRLKDYDNKDNWINTELNLSFVLNTGFAAFKAGEVGQETYYTEGQGLLKDAIDQYGGDEAFLFFISQPQWIKINPKDPINPTKGTLGGITYDIDFNSTVANEVFNIGGRAIIDGYLKDLEITKPTYNYANPKGYLFTFPEYNDN